mmetsp:Transcript_40033/g.89927  ORF Transcript_40033/g.89927 Transcript_40033/m.89927 type:complete len:526 (+) Transcript_40033:23-1600(+)
MLFWLPFGAVAVQPNVIFMLADDLGWMDVSFHGSQQVRTPNIDNLANGVSLDNYHAMPACSPTRASILTGRHSIHHGVYVQFAPGSDAALNSTYKLLPRYLKEQGYRTHMVGKWHLGDYKMSVLPTSRGFDTFLGYLSGAEDYFNHTIATSMKGHAVGYDFSRGSEPAWEFSGKYSTKVFTDRVVHLVNDVQPGDPPFFIYAAYQATHWPLQAPQSYFDRASLEGNITDPDRLAFAAALLALDDGVGRVTEAVQSKELWNNTLIVFSSDNGGGAVEIERGWPTQSFNFPLRGGKHTIWEGGTRTIAAVSGGFVIPGSAKSQLIHAVDWLPTLVTLAGGNWTSIAEEDGFELGDGMDVSAVLQGDRSPREELLHETHPSDGVHGAALTVGKWKLVKLRKERNTLPGWYLPVSVRPDTQHSLACSAPPSDPDPDQCTKQWCLFDMEEDPCEIHDVAESNQDVVDRMRERLAEYRATARTVVNPMWSGGACVPELDRNGAWRPCDALGVDKDGAPRMPWEVDGDEGEM